MRTLVTFKSAAFNTSEPRDYFINPSCFGDDLARWLIGELQRHGVKTIGEANQEDFGWYFNFSVCGMSHTFAVGFRPDDSTTEGDWVGQLERERGFVGSMFGGRKRGIQRDAAYEIHRVLSESPCISDVRWHFLSDFDKGAEEAGAQEP